MLDRQSLVEDISRSVAEIEQRASFPDVGVVLGTGWGDLLELEDEEVRPLSEFRAFREAGDLTRLEGHKRHLVLGALNGRQIAALRGRVHLNEHPTSRFVPLMVRLQVEILIALGVKTLILTAAVGSLTETVKVGDVVLVDGFVTIFAPPMPLFAGEFVSPEDTLDAELRRIARQAAPDGLSVHEGGHAMVRGPFFEGRKYDKTFLRQTGASVVGMSLLPEACVAATHGGVRVLGLGFVTNTASEEHSHETNQARAKEKAPLLGGYLKSIIAEL